MRKNEFVLQIPYGMRDYLPREAAVKRRIESSLAGIFYQWGYDEVVTPTIEYLDTLTTGTGSAAEPHMFKFFDRGNRTLALRHEMTTPIARVAASRLAEAALPLKLSYVAGVYRYEEVQTGRQCEFNQAGVELMGAASASADAEVIALAVEGMRGAGLRDFRISLGQVEFISGVMAEANLTPELQGRMKRALVGRDLVALEAMVDAAELTQDARTALKKIPLLHGKEDLLKAARQLARNERSRRALDHLAEIYQLLKAYGVEAHVYFDLGVIRDFEYYTGMVFEAYTPGLGFPLCGGGRYDTMLSDFGSACPATGFAMGIERIMLALERQGLAAQPSVRDVYVAWRDANAPLAIAEAKKLREAGKSVEVALWAQSEAEAQACRKAKGYRRVVYMG